MWNMGGVAGGVRALKCIAVIRSGRKDELGVPAGTEMRALIDHPYDRLVPLGADFSHPALTRRMKGRRIETWALFGGSLVDQPAYRRLPLRVVGDLPVSRWLRDAALFVGCHPGIGDAERQYVVASIGGFLDGRRPKGAEHA